jgi:Flp pilus assembly protein TadG
MPKCQTAKNTIRRLIARLSQERGQSVVEFAVILPVLLLIILGIVYFGRYETYSSQLNQLAEQGAREAAVNFDPPGTPTLQQYLFAQAQGELANGSSDVTTPLRVYIYQPASATSWTAGQAVRVCVLATVTFPTPIGSPPATITQTATMRIDTAAASNPYAAGNVSTSAPVQTSVAPYTAGSPNTAIPSKCSQS